MAQITPRDSQRSKVYTFERKVAALFPELMDQEWTKAEIRENIALVCEAYGVPCPKITFSKRLKVRCYFDPITYKIALKAEGTFGHLARVALHETAHAICEHAGLGMSEAPHGPHFVRLLMDLYAGYLGVPEAALTRHCLLSGVKAMRDWNPERYGPLWTVMFDFSSGPKPVKVRARDAAHAKRLFGQFQWAVQNVEAIEAPF